jgi:hypothetical protein
MPIGVNSRYNSLVDRYMEMWNETDATARRKLVDEVWAEDGAYFNRLFVARGRDIIEAAVATAHDEYYAKGFSFKSQNDAYGHHGGVKFGWVMITTSTGEVDTFGQDFVILDGEDRITMDYQFGMKPPSL